MTVVRVFFKTNVTVSAVTVSVVKTNVFSTLEGTWVRIHAYLHYMAGPGFNFGGPKTGRAWKFLRKKRAEPGKKINGPGWAAIFRPVQGYSEDMSDKDTVVQAQAWTSVLRESIYWTCRSWRS